MRNLALILLCIMATTVLPSWTHAQTPFGGLDDAIFPMCDCTPMPVMLSCTQPVPTPPENIFYLFAPLWIGTGMPIGGFLALPIEDPVLAYPDYALVPSEWALGELLVTPPTPPTTCGMYIPIDACYPYPIIAGLCVPIFPAIGVVTPFTGAAPGLF